MFRKNKNKDSKLNDDKKEKTDVGNTNSKEDLEVKGNENQNMKSKEDTKSSQKAGKDKKDTKEKKDRLDSHTPKRSIFTKRAIFFLVINLLAVIFLLILLSEIPKKALELKTLINAQIRAEASSKVNYADLELESNKELIDDISKLFPDDQGLVEFIKTMENIKIGGILINFSFASKEPVRDQTGNPGIPVIAQFRGSWEQIDAELQKIQEAPYLFRPITVEAKRLPEENVIELMYGGFLYVDEEL